MPKIIVNSFFRVTRTGDKNGGLFKVGSSLVPFVNKFPRNTELYKLMTTKFGEV